MPLRKDPERQRVFLETLESTGSLIEAARQASPHSEKGAYSTFKCYARDNPEFAAKIGEALDSFRDSLVREAVRRGRDGTSRPIYQRGELVGHEQVYSDHLLTLELKKHFRGDYAEKHQHDHRVMIEPAGAWSIGTDDIAALSHEQREQLRGIMTTIRDRRREMAALPEPAIEDAEYEEVMAEADGEWHSPDEPIAY